MPDSNSSTLQLCPLCDAHDVSLVGGKAINLAKLMQAKLPVPDGFVVTTVAFRSAQSGKVSADLADEIRSALSRFEGQIMAVRSSATAEDMAGASMAGQYDTFLNCDSPEAIIEAVEKCWASIRSERILAYLKENAIDPDEVAMAVVVQRQVESAVAGVLFTVDPRSGDRDHMLIEASWGLGETLVSGDVQPDLVRIDASTTTVLEYTVADKQKALFPGKAEFQDVDPGQRKRACLSYEQIERLVQVGQQAERFFGQPQDIEWAIEQGVVFAVQARPITTLTETDAYNERLASVRQYLTDRVEQGAGPWVRHNLGETLPQPTPLTWSIVSQFMSGDGGFGKMHQMLGFEPSDAVRERSFLDLLGNEIYMDCSLMTELFAKDYPFAYDPERLRSDPDAAQQPPSVPMGTFADRRRAAEIGQTAAQKVAKIAASLDKEFDKEFIPKVLRWTDEQSAITLTELSDCALFELWEAQVQTVLDEFGPMAFLPSMVETVAVDQLRDLLKEHVWDEAPEVALARLAVSPVMDRTLAGNVALGQVAKGDLSLENWLKEFGHRATAEFDLASPRWKELSVSVESLAQQTVDGIDIEKQHATRLKDADVFLDELRQSLDAATFAEIRSASEQVRRYLRFREDGKFYLMLAYSTLRYTALDFGRRLKIGDDVFYMLPEEIKQSLETGYLPKDRIVKRRLASQVATQLKLPHVIESDDIEKLGTTIVDTSVDSVDAHSVSRGVVSGPIRIVFKPSSVEAFEAGSILVCPSTDPSWTPLFAKVGGLILERGGSLSHGAVVAREMGLPAVVFDGATSFYKEGELLTVDADSGKIYREGAEVVAVEDEAIPAIEIPPVRSQKEAQVNRIGLMMALFWGLVLALIFLLPPKILHDPCIQLIDWVIWPLISNFGMIAAVATVAGVFGLLPIVGQRWMTDNRRILEAKRRASALRKSAAKLPAESLRRKRMEQLAAPVTLRILKASMVPLACVLGPMIMIFMWFPMRVDPLSWSAEPGRMVSVVMEVDGETNVPVEFTVAEPLKLSSIFKPQQSLPPIRAELEELRKEWQQGSDLSGLPWEVQSAGDHARQVLMSSLNSYLQNGIPAQTLTWMIDVPTDASGSHPVSVKTGDQVVSEFDMVFGQSAPPGLALIEPATGPVRSITVKYPRALTKASFFILPGTSWDIGWLGIYLLAYLPTMFIAKWIFRVP
ncbi:MAG: PEP/pyruvate-binding domain-containing protein [Opitutaceae bacterium]